MGKPYSQDLRERVMAAVDSGTGAYTVAPLFRVSVSYIYKVLGRRRATGETSRTCGRVSGCVACGRMQGKGQHRLPVEQAAISRLTAKKKSERAAEQDRPDVAEAREEWHASQPDLDRK